MKILYWDTFAGISGDMALGSLIALGADPGIIVNQLHSMGLTEFVLDVLERQVHGIKATDINVVILGQNSEHDNHEDHDHHKHEHEHEHDHEHKHKHKHKHDHEHNHNRRLPDIQKMILSGDLSDRARKMPLRSLMF
ncbi:MAG: DUF111 family protein [Desulfosporosinus sp.]|nr:DUF111 family protein [Desulfosporosinus sp.]